MSTTDSIIKELNNVDNLNLFQPKSSEEIWATGTKFGSQAGMNFHDALDYAGWISPYADAANAVAYATEGKFGMAALSTVGVVPVLGDYMKHLLKSWKAIDKGEETVTLWRGVKGIDDPETLVKGDKVVGNWGKTQSTYLKMFSKGAAHNSRTDAGEQLIDTIAGKGGVRIQTYLPKSVSSKNVLFTTNKKNIAEQYLREGEGLGGMLLEFKVPKSYLNTYGRDATGRLLTDPVTIAGKTLDGKWGSKGLEEVMDKAYPSILFTDGLPVETLRNISTIAGK